MKRLIYFAIFAVFILSACGQNTPASPDQPVSSDPATPSCSTSEPSCSVNPTDQVELPIYLPQPDDKLLVEGVMMIDTMEVLIMESFPPQISLHITGALPTPCHNLRVQVAAPDAKGIFQVKVYSVTDPNAICTQVLEPFDQSISLNGYPK
ncbi:MAG: hypothetical protein HGA86_07100, partial [Anaerolineaceae bacterium]|nr:hypothetical protein [Anaerolineaceae bacterium]